MVNFVYDAARESFLKGDLNWTTDDIRCILVDTAAYTANQATDDFLNDITTPNRVATSPQMTTMDAAAGVADAADITFTTVTGAECEALVIYKHTGTDTTSNLIAYIDTATGLAVTPSGGDITVTWDNGTNKIFKL